MLAIDTSLIAGLGDVIDLISNNSNKNYNINNNDNDNNNNNNIFLL